MKLPVLFTVLMLAGCTAVPSVESSIPSSSISAKPTVTSKVSATATSPRPLLPKPVVVIPKPSSAVVKQQAIGNAGSSHFVGQCGSKRYCTDMQSCEEARFYLSECGLNKLDKDSDGIPCESLCGN